MPNAIRLVYRLSIKGKSAFLCSVISLYGFRQMALESTIPTQYMIYIPCICV